MRDACALDKFTEVMVSRGNEPVCVWILGHHYLSSRSKGIPFLLNKIVLLLFTLLIVITSIENVMQE